MASLQRNIASQNLTFAFVNATTGSALVSAAGISGFVTKDNGAQVAIGGTVTEKGRGQYNYAPTQAETSATDVGFIFSATGAIPANLDFHTDPVSGGFVSVDLASINGTALAGHAAGMVPADVRDIVGVAVNSGAAQLGVNVAQISGSTAAVALDSQSLLKVDAEDWKGAVIAAPATSGVPDINLINVGGVALATHAAGMVPADVRDIVGATVNTAVAQVGVNVVSLGGVPIALDINNLLKVDVEAINADQTAAQNVAKANHAIGRGVTSVGDGVTLSAISASTFTPTATVSGQFIGRTVIFDATTITAALRGQASPILANTTGAGPVFTVSALTTAAATGDTFGVY